MLMATAEIIEGSLLSAALNVIHYSVAVLELILSTAKCF